MSTILRTPVSLLLMGLALVSCGSDDSTVAESSEETTTVIKSAYVLSNSATANAVISYTRSSDGRLTFAGETTTGGSGTGAEIPGVNGTLVYEPYYGILYAVNTGSNSISAFYVETDGSLTLLDTENSQGIRPVSLAVVESVVYVANQGDANNAANVAGFVLSGDDLLPINDSVQPLSTAQPEPGQIRFTPNPSVIVVSERANNAFTSYSINSSLAPYGRKSSESLGATPGGFAFKSTGVMIASEAQGNVSGAGSASSYVVGGDGSMTTVSESVTNGQSGTASALVLSNGLYAFTANPESDSLTTYAIASSGALTLQGEAISNPGGPLELAVSDDEAFLYTLNRQDDSISIYGLDGDSGRLTSLDRVTGLPTASIGLAVR